MRSIPSHPYIEMINRKISFLELGIRWIVRDVQGIKLPDILRKSKTSNFLEIPEKKFKNAKKKKFSKKGVKFEI